MLSRMSKAFTKDDAPVEAVIPPRTPLPEGATNYVTPRGMAQLAEERKRLNEVRGGLERGDAGADRDQALAAVHGRLAELDGRIASAVVVDPSSFAHDKARLGAWVTVEAADGTRRRFRIVGVDEADAGAGLIAFVSPVGRALLGKSVGEEVSVRTPRGRDAFEIVEIDYSVSLSEDP
jgi:transcription elongation factor GreB